MKHFALRGLLIAGMVLALVAGGLLGVWILRLPAPASQVPPAAIVVSLTHPSTGTGAGAGDPVQVSAHVAASRPIVAAELWVDDAVVAQATPSRVAENSYAAFFEWTATPGPHVLLVRATDDQGRVGSSNVVRLEGLVATDSLRLEPFVARGDGTLEELARFKGVTVDDLLRYNPSLDEGQSLGAGQTVSIPIPAHYDPTWEEPPPPPPPASTQPGSAGVPLSPLRYALGTLIGRDPATPPLAPGLSAGAQGCSAALMIDDRSSIEAGFLVYRLNPGEPSFDLIATLGPHTGQGGIGYNDPGLSGSYAYYVASFNAAGETPGPIVQVGLPAEACGAGAWSGDLKLEGNRMISPVPAEQAYFYASVNGGVWRRVPANPHAFLPAVQGGYDISTYLADLAPDGGGRLMSLSLDGWGWSGGALVSLGQGALHGAAGPATGGLPGLYDWTSLQGSSVPQVVLDPSTKKPLYFSSEVVFSKAEDFTFRWKTGSPSASSGRWEVSRSPYFLPSFLVAEGVAGIDPTYAGYSYFPIPFGELLALTINIGDQPVNPVMQGPVLFGSEASLNLGQGESVALLPAFGAAEASLAYGGLPPIGGGLANEYYVRLTPMIGNQPVGEASNTVVVRYDAEAEASPDIQIPSLGPEFYTSLYTVEILDYTPGALEDPNAWGCVEFVKVEPGSAAAMLGYKPGDRECPPAYTGAGYQGWKGVKKDLNKLGGYLEKGANWAAKAWQDIKAFAVQIILKYTPLGLQCQFAEKVALPEGTCQKVFSVGVDLALASMGIPPTIPNFDQLMDEGLDYAVELAAQEALKELPACVGPCEDAVKDTIRKALETAIDQVAGQSIAPSCVSESEAHQNGAEPWCPPPGAVVRPMLGAVDSPPTVLVRLTRRPDVPDPANMPACTLTVGATYTVHGFNPGYPTFSSSPFSGGSLPIPSLSPGESIKIAVALDSRNPVYFPWKSYIGSPYVYGDAGAVIWHGTSYAFAGATFVVPPYAQGAPPAPCAPSVAGPEVGPQISGWKKK